MQNKYRKEKEKKNISTHSRISSYLILLYYVPIYTDLAYRSLYSPILLTIDMWTIISVHRHHHSLLHPRACFQLYAIQFHSTDSKLSHRFPDIGELAKFLFHALTYKTEGSIILIYHLYLTKFVFIHTLTIQYPINFACTIILNNQAPK